MSGGDWQFGRAAWALPALAGLVLAAARADERAEFEKLLGSRAGAIVTVKFVLQLKMGGMFGGMGETETENEISGVMIDPGGLVLVSNTQLGGFAGLMRQMMGRAGGGEVTATPTEIKVLVGEDTEGVEAELLARDSELDLAWVRVKEAGGRSFTHIDLEKHTKPALGQRLLALNRMSRHFGRTTIVQELRVGGFARKPRELIVTSGGGEALGLPVFTAEGEPVGVQILQLPEADESASPAAMFGRMSELRSLAPVILPASEVVKATARAREHATETAKPAAPPEKPDTPPETPSEENP